MTHTIRRTAIAVLVSGLALAPAASAGVVPNIFQRSCYFRCSAFVQSNGAYQGQYPSLCITKTWGGSTSYQLPAGRRC